MSLVILDAKNILEFKIWGFKNEKLLVKKEENQKDTG